VRVGRGIVIVPCVWVAWAFLVAGDRQAAGLVCEAWTGVRCGFYLLSWVNAGAG